MSRAITRLLLTASLTLVFILRNGALVHAIPTSAAFKSTLNDIIQQRSISHRSTSDGCSSNSGAVDTGNANTFWMERIKHQGKAPFNPYSEDYKVFRNVKVCSLMELGYDMVLILCLGLWCCWRWCSRRHRGDQVSISMTVFIIVLYFLLLCSEAITDQDRCGGGKCGSSTYVYHSSALFIGNAFIAIWTRVSPAIVYFPQG